VPPASLKATREEGADKRRFLHGGNDRGLKWKDSGEKENDGGKAVSQDPGMDESRQTVPPSPSSRRFVSRSAFSTIAEEKEANKRIGRCIYGGNAFQEKDVNERRSFHTPSGGRGNVEGQKGRRGNVSGWRHRKKEGCR